MWTKNENKNKLVIILENILCFQFPERCVSQHFFFIYIFSGDLSCLFLFFDFITGICIAYKKLNNSRWLKITNESHKQKKITINIWCYFYFAPSENFYVSYIMLVLEKEMAVHSSILAWAIPWREERGRLQSVLSHFSHIFLFATPWTVVWQVPLTMGFSRQEYWSGLPFPFPGNLPDPGI